MTLFATVCIYIYTYIGARGGLMVKVLHYKPVGRGFDSLEFFSDILQVTLWP
jgi:hypothetical protein